MNLPQMASRTLSLSTTLTPASLNTCAIALVLALVPRGNSPMVRGTDATVVPTPTTCAAPKRRMRRSSEARPYGQSRGVMPFSCAYLAAASTMGRTSA
jgi:hypothetical protein